MSLELRKPNVFLVVLLVGVGCHSRRQLRPPMLSPTSGDSVALVSVAQSKGERLEKDVPTELLVTLQYTLSSRDRALLVLDLDQFSNNETCTNSRDLGAQTNRRETVATQAIQIASGTHTVQVRVTWPGGKSESNSVRSGAVSFQASMLSEDPGYSFLTYRFGTQYCMQF
jgi:hypothetical protein